MAEGVVVATCCPWLVRDLVCGRACVGDAGVCCRTGTCRVVGGGVRTCVMLCDRVVSAGDPGSAMSASQAL